MIIENLYSMGVFRSWNEILPNIPLKFNKLLPEALHLAKSSSIISYMKFKENVYEHTILPAFVHA